MIEMVDNDLHFVASLSGSDIRLIKLACEQLAYTSVKHSKAGGDRIFPSQLAEVKDRIDKIGNYQLSMILQ